MNNPAPGFEKNPDRIIRLEPSPRRVRLKFGDEWIADSTEMMLMFETGHLPVYYFPVKDVRLDLLHSTDLVTYCKYKGEATYWSTRFPGLSRSLATPIYRAHRPAHAADAPAGPSDPPHRR